MTHLSIAALRAAYEDKSATPQDIVADVFLRIRAQTDTAIFISLRSEADVAADAGRLAALPWAERAKLPLYGIPFVIKDNIDCTDLPTTAGCPAFAYQPTEDSGVVARLKAAGALLIGKTNLDQFATGLVGTRSPFGAPKNAFSAVHVPGGSSCGSAIAVATGLAAFSLGTDTAGSGRVPAAFNNLVGLKPSCGLVSTRGVVPACRSIDCVSIFANTAADAAQVLAACGVYDARDPYSRHLEPTGLPPTPTIGVPGASFLEPLSASYKRLYTDYIDVLKRAGWQVRTFDFTPFSQAATLLYGGSFVAERYTAIGAFLEDHKAEMDPTVAQIIGAAKAKGAHEVFADMQTLADLRRTGEAALEGIDVMLLPTAPFHPTLAEVEADKIGVNAALGRYTNFVNLMDFAALACPAGMTPEGLPFGITLVARAGTDQALAALAAHLLNEPAAAFLAAPAREIEICVVGAHLSGQPLNHQLTELGARLVGDVTTAAPYRFYALPGSQPAKPGLVHEPGFAGPGIAGELWALSPAGFGRFVAQVPSPMVIGTVTLSDGRRVKGFLAEPFAFAGAEEITQLGGWRAYMARGR